jgi:hypothetical protein
MIFNAIRESHDLRSQYGHAQSFERDTVNR